jgi:hypothetical protein
VASDGRHGPPVVPEAFERLDRARGAAFPFTPDDVQGARALHDGVARVGADARCRLQVESVGDRAGADAVGGRRTALGRARLDAVERESSNGISSDTRNTSARLALQALFDK